MKKIYFSLTSLFLIFSACQPSVKEAIAYNEEIVSHHEDVDKKIAFLIDTYDNYLPVEMDSAYQVALKAALEGIDFASNLKPFHKDDSYRKAVLELFKLYKSVIEVEHARIIELLKLPPEQYQQKQIDEFDQLKDSADKKVIKKIDEVYAVQVEFAKKFNFTLEDDVEE